MRIFQNSGVYPGYLPVLRRLTAAATAFTGKIDAFLDDRYGAAHWLEPVLNRDPAAFFTNADHEETQRAWARESGMPASTRLNTILLAQIEQHRTEVFYNMDPMRYGSAFVRMLPGCVKASIAWRAAPSPGADFEAYDLVVCNFPSILEDYRQRGWKAAYFSPAHDPVMDEFAANVDRPTDVLFIGGYSRHHQQRAQVLEAVASLHGEYHVTYHLDRSRLTRLAESPLGRLVPVSQHRRPSGVRAVSTEPVFGRALYRAISNAKIVLNGAVDMAGTERGNMRCFEAMGCGALMVSDDGRYPEGMVGGQTMLSYATPQDAAQQIRGALASPIRLAAIAATGHDTMVKSYTKEGQWRAFQKLLEQTA